MLALVFLHSFILECDIRFTYYCWIFFSKFAEKVIPLQSENLSV